MAADCQYLSKETVESDPGIYVDNGPKKDAHELVVVGDEDEVLVRHCYTGGQIDYQNDPGTYLRMA
jgi:hypothetical protein